MIKIATLEFEKLQSQNYWADFYKFGACIHHDVKYYQEWNEVPLRLNDGKCYQIGMDQSTTNTGIIVKDYENTVVYIMGVTRQHASDPYADYIWALEQLLHRIFDGAIVSHLIYERPIISESYRSSRVLFQLEGMLQQLPRRYPEFKTACLDYVANSSWRHVVILKELQNSLDRKRASYVSVCRIFNWAQFYGDSLGKDYDEFEAVGILFGWFFDAYDPLGRPYVRGDRYPGGVGGFILPGLSAREVSEQFELAGIKSRWLMESPKKSIFENLVCGVQNYEVVCVELSSVSSMLALTVECNKKWENPERMVVVLVPVNHVDKRLFEITGEEYHFVV